MAATTTALAVKTRYRKQVGDVAETLIDDTLLLEILQDAVAAYSEHRPVWTSATISVLANTIDYAIDAETRIVTSLWDLTDGVETAPQMRFEVIDVDGLKIRLVDALPTPGRVLTYYFAKNHTKPADLLGGTILTVDDADIRLILDWMGTQWAKIRLNALLSQSGAGKWKAGMREEDSTSAIKGLQMLVADGESAWRKSIAKPSSLYGADRPMEQGMPRPTLVGAGRYQGTLGWTGGSPGDRRRGV